MEAEQLQQYQVSLQNPFCFGLQLPRKMQKYLMEDTICSFFNFSMKAAQIISIEQLFQQRYLQSYPWFTVKVSCTETDLTGMQNW